jgi:hypothetical protein
MLTYDNLHFAVNSVESVGKIFPKDRSEVVIFYVEIRIPIINIYLFKFGA